MRFAHFKSKDLVLSSARKFKGTCYAVAQDLAPSTRLAQKRLIEFGRARKLRFKLRHEKLIVGEKPTTSTTLLTRSLRNAFSHH